MKTCPKLIIETPVQCCWYLSGVFVCNINRFYTYFSAFLLKKYLFKFNNKDARTLPIDVFQCLSCWLWNSICLIGFFGYSEQGSFIYEGITSKSMLLKKGRIVIAHLLTWSDQENYTYTTIFNLMMMMKFVITT